MRRVRVAFKIHFSLLNVKIVESVLVTCFGVSYILLG